jgi:hypothetical protein
MKKLIISFALNSDFCDMLGIALPTFYKYAVKYDYDLWIPSYEEVKRTCSALGWDYERPTSWLKVPLIKKALEDYDVVLWIDCDVVVLNNSPDISSFIGSDNLQGFVVHRDKYEGYVPNCGVWILTKLAKEYLSNIWNQNQFINHPWWEQRANLYLMNWQTKSHNQSLTEYGMKSIELPYAFNVHKNDIRFDAKLIHNNYFLHATTWPDRKNIMREWAKL